MMVITKKSILLLIVFSFPIFSLDQEKEILDKQIELKLQEIKNTLNNRNINTEKILNDTEIYIEEPRASLEEKEKFLKVLENFSSILKYENNFYYHRYRLLSLGLTSAFSSIFISTPILFKYLCNLKADDFLPLVKFFTSVEQIELDINIFKETTVCLETMNDIALVTMLSATAIAIGTSIFFRKILETNKNNINSLYNLYKSRECYDEAFIKKILASFPESKNLIFFIIGNNPMKTVP